MRRSFTDFLLDPETKHSLALTVFEENPEHVVAGLLQNEKNWYPIIDGIPRLLMGELKTSLLQEHRDCFEKFKNVLPERVKEEWSRAIAGIKNLDAFLRHQKKTGESFAYEWRHIYRENDYEKRNFFHFLSPFVKEGDLAGKVTLDIGCGSGRFTKWAALSGATMAFGTDLGESVVVAYEMTKDLANVCIVQADIYSMPFQHQFDLAYSIGVLHHLPRPQEGFSRLPNVLKPGGKMLIWVYNRRHNFRALYLYEPLRAVLRHLPKPLLYRLCYVPAALVHGINLIGKWFASIGFPQVERRLPFSYYGNFPFNMKLNDAFDVLATPKSNYYFVEEIEKWFREAQLKDIESFEHPEAGITCIGIYGT